MKKFLKFMASATAVAAGVASVVYLFKDKSAQDDLADDFEDDFDDDFEDLEENPAPAAEEEPAPAPKPPVKGFRATTRDNQ